MPTLILVFFFKIRYWKFWMNHQCMWGQGQWRHCQPSWPLTLTYCPRYYCKRRERGRERERESRFINYYWDACTLFSKFIFSPSPPPVWIITSGPEQVMWFLYSSAWSSCWVDWTFCTSTTKTDPTILRNANGENTGMHRDILRYTKLYWDMQSYTKCSYLYI